MAIETPAHRKRLGFHRLRHLIDATVTGLTGYALPDMDTVMEKGMTWQFVHGCPFDRCLESEARASGSSEARPLQICEWHVRHVCADGMPADAAFSTDA